MVRKLLVIAAVCSTAQAGPVPPPTQQTVARAIYKQLVELDTTAEHGDSAAAARAMAARLVAAGIPSADVHVFEPAPKHGNLVARLRGTGKRIPCYGHSGLAADIFDVRAHGKDERVAVASFYEGQEYLYELVKVLAGGR